VMPYIGGILHVITCWRRWEKPEVFGELSSSRGNKKLQAERRVVTGVKLPIRWFFSAACSFNRLGYGAIETKRTSGYSWL